MNFKILADAIEGIDGGCTNCIHSFLEELAPGLTDDEKRALVDAFDLSSYPITAVLVRDGWQSSEELCDLYNIPKGEQPHG